MCYTGDKLEHKTKILTTKININIKRTKMAATIQKTTKIDWKKEIGIDYATYANEKGYVSPSEVTSENMERLRGLRQKLENFPGAKRKLAVKH